jgi:dTDP-4-amino-4,6-dideoxygalactose transaminase
MASIGISQLKQINQFIISRRNVCCAYTNAFKNISDLRVPETDFSNVSPFIYSLRVLNGKRDSLIKHMQNNNVDVGVHFIPVHRHKHFSNCRYGEMSVTNLVAQEVLTLPLHSNMKNEYVERVIAAVSSYYK